MRSRARIPPGRIVSFRRFLRIGEALVSWGHIPAPVQDLEWSLLCIKMAAAALAKPCGQADLRSLRQQPPRILVHTKRIARILREPLPSSSSDLPMLTGGGSVTVQHAGGWEVESAVSSWAEPQHLPWQD
ncbi:UNVERIFIED_CONTAM: hypothetical protein K2H54_003054 [Gekko kuhli]